MNTTLSNQLPSEIAGKSEASFTPGPWSVSGIRTRSDGQPFLQILGPDDNVYALVFYSDRTTKDHTTSHADARLIAAAPELLAALQKCVTVFEQLADAGNYPLPLLGNGGWHFAVQAIAKAEGRQS